MTERERERQTKRWTDNEIGFSKRQSAYFDTKTWKLNNNKNCKAAESFNLCSADTTGSRCQWRLAPVTCYESIKYATPKSPCTVSIFPTPNMTEKPVTIRENLVKSIFIFLVKGNIQYFFPPVGRLTQCRQVSSAYSFHFCSFCSTGANLIMGSEIEKSVFY